MPNAINKRHSQMGLIHFVHSHTIQYNHFVGKLIPNYNVWYTMGWYSGS